MTGSDEQAPDLEAQIEDLLRRRRAMLSAEADLAHSGRRIDDALERAGGGTGDLQARRRDLLSGRRLAMRDLRRIDAEIERLKATIEARDKDR